RDPARPDEAIRYRDVSADELFEATRLVIAAEIAKIHTIEWTPQLLYDEPLYRASNANWDGLLREDARVARMLDRVLAGDGANSARMSSQWYSVLASGTGILGLGNRMRSGGFASDRWSIADADHLNGGVNHFGSPFSFPEEFVTVYRLHPLVP